MTDKGPIFRRLSEDDLRDFNDPLRFWKGFIIALAISGLFYAGVVLLWCCY